MNFTQEETFSFLPRQHRTGTGDCFYKDVYLMLTNWGPVPPLTDSPIQSPILILFSGSSESMSWRICVSTAASVSRDSELPQGIPLKAGLPVSPQPNRSTVENKAKPSKSQQKQVTSDVRSDRHTAVTWRCGHCHTVGKPQPQEESTFEPGTHGSC